MGVHDGTCIVQEAAQGRCKPEFFENLTPPPCKHGSQKVVGPRFGTGLSRVEGGVTLPLHPPLSTTRAGNPKGSHAFSPFPSLWALDYTGLKTSTSKKAQFLFLQPLQSATPADYVGGQPPKLGLCTVTCVRRQRPTVFSKRVSPAGTKDEKINSL